MRVVTAHHLTREHDQWRDTRSMKYWSIDGLLDAGKLLVRGYARRPEGVRRNVVLHTMPYSIHRISLGLRGFLGAPNGGARLSRIMVVLGHMGTKD